MENLELTFEEQYELEIRGFFVKEILSKKQYFVTLFSYLCIYTIGILILIFLILIIGSSMREYLGVDFNVMFNGFLTQYYYASLCGIILLYLYITIKFGAFRYLMHSENAYIINNESYDYIDQIPTRYFGAKQMINNLGGEFLEYLKNPGIGYSRNGKDIIGELFLWFFMICTTGIILILTAILFILGILIMKAGKYCISIRYFITLGEKIQKLTPQISEISTSIQENFQSDMNFKVLSDGFDSLSSIFSQIVSLVIKLEKIESRANKGNLFDSEKYINSLRTDITKPLMSLKLFLEKQKIELIESWKELSRVRVGESESTGNIELQSKRSESLITELSENIEKLDEMIGKIG